MPGAGEGSEKGSEKGIERAVEALFSGARMLSFHCAGCKGPLFEKEGKIFCPTCGEKGGPERAAGETAGKTLEEGLEGALRKKLEELLGELKARLETEKDHEQFMKTLKEIDALVEVLRKLRT